MGVARLLAKGWVVFCLFAGGHALNLALASGAAPAQAIATVGVSVLLFIAMGLLFAGGYGASSAQGGPPLLQRLKPRHLMPGFNELVFLVFVTLSFVNQVAVAPQHIEGGAASALQAAIYFAVPGQRALVAALAPCGLDGGRIFASSFTWLLAIVYLGSTVSRLKLAAGIIRIERAKRPEALGPTLLALLLGVTAVVGIQMLFVGTVFQFLPCSTFADITGAVLIGLAPLMLSYLILAALAALMATSPE